MNDGHYRTFDMALAVSLQLHGYTPQLERADGSAKIEFCFSLRDAGGEVDLQTLLDNYASGDLLVEPRRFMNVQKILRQRLYALTGGRLEPGRG